MTSGLITGRSGLRTAAQVEAAGPALAAGSLKSVERAIGELERTMRAAAVAATARLPVVAEQVKETIGKLRRLMTDTGYQPESVALGLTSVLDEVTALAERDRAAVAAVPAVLTAQEIDAIIADLISLTDLGRVTGDGMGALGLAVWQDAADLLDLARTVSELAQNVGSPDVSARFMLPDPPDRSQGLESWIDAVRMTADDAKALRSDLTEVTNQAIEGVRRRHAAALQLGGAASQLLENATVLVPGVQGLAGKLADALARASEDAPALAAPPAELADQVRVASRVQASLVALADLTEHVLTIATTGLAERVEAARDLESALTGLLPFTDEDELAKLAPDLDAARGAVRDLPVMSGPRPRGPGDADLVDWVGQAGRAFAAIARLIRDASAVAAAAAAPLDKLQADVAATLELAQAARQFLPAGMPARIDDAAGELRALQPTWWPAGAGAMATAQHASVVIAAMATRDATRQALDTGIGGVIAEAFRIIRQRAGIIAKLAVTGRKLVAFGHQQSLSDRFDEIRRRALDLARSGRPDRTLAEAEATAADLERLSYLQAALERVVAQAATGLAERLDAAAPLAAAALALLPYTGAGQDNLRHRVTAARDSVTRLPAWPGALSTEDDLRVTADTLALLADLEKAAGDVLAAATAPVDPLLGRVTEARLLAQLVRSLAPADEPAQLEELIAAGNEALQKTFELVPGWWPQRGAPVPSPALLDDARMALTKGLGAKVLRVARELRATAEATHAGLLVWWDDQLTRADNLAAEINYDLPGTGAHKDDLTSAADRLKAAGTAVPGCS